MMRWEQCRAGGDLGDSYGGIVATRGVKVAERERERERKVLFLVAKQSKKKKIFNDTFLTRLRSP